MPPLVILWRVFEPCNLACDFCGYSKELQRERGVADVRQVLKFGEVLSAYRRIHPRPILVSWLGGEPLLWPELPGLSRRFHGDLGLQLSLTTNGTLLAERTIRQLLLSEYAEATVSVDGIGGFHDRCRKAPGLYNQLRENLTSLAAEVAAAGSPLVLKVNTILMRGNIADFERLCREVAAWGVRELTFNQLGGQDRPEFYPANRLLPEQVERFAQELPGIRERLACRGLEIHGSRQYLARLAATAGGEPLPVEDCAPGSSFLFIDEHGSVGPCSFTARDYGVRIEDLTMPDNLAQLPHVFSERRRLHVLPPCTDCHSTQLFGKFAQSL